VTTDISVVVLDDDPFARDGIRNNLVSNGFRVVTVRDLAEFEIAVESERFDVALIDLELKYREPLLTGFAALDIAVARGNGVRPIVFTWKAGGAECERARKAGAKGFLARARTTADALVKAIRFVLDGKTVFDDVALGEGVARTAASGDIKLSSREREVLQLIWSDRLTNPQIGNKLHISAYTVKTILARCFEKLGCRERYPTARKARELGLI
jgi:DNA-binding NarL/FixJ family response regulator